MTGLLVNALGWTILAAIILYAVVVTINHEDGGW